MNADEALRFIEELIRVSGTRPLNDLQRSIFRGAWLGKDYKEIHRECGQVGLDHIMRNVGPRLWKRLSDLVSDRLGELIEIRKEALRGPIERLHDRLKAHEEPPELDSRVTPPIVQDLPFNSFEELWNTQSANRHQDWGQAPAASHFQGREQELETLFQWVEEEGCRLIALLGTAGMGKTDLSVKLAERLRDRFERVIWRSLDSATTGAMPPHLSTLLADFHQSWADPIPFPDLNQFIQGLRQQRCLIVVDSFDAVLQGQALSGDYCSGYDSYGDLLKRVGDTQHLSCFILTSREMPREVETRAGKKAFVRVHRVPGLSPRDVQNLFLAKGRFSATEPDWRSLTYQYDGNPRFLQQVAFTVTHAFGSNVSRFLEYQQNQAIVVGDIRRSLDQQMARLSTDEIVLLQKLAHHQEPATLAEIQQFVEPSMSPHHLLEVLLSLVRRSLLNSSAISYGLHPLIRQHIAPNRDL